MTCSNASRRARSAFALALTCAVWFVAGAHRTQAAGVVGTGSAASCTDAALNTALTGGGLVTFNCGGGLVTIDISPGAGGTGTKTIAADTTINGGSQITISGGHSVGVFSVNDGVTFAVQNLTIAKGNSADYGGGISNGGTLTVTNSTFSGNSAELYGGGISNYGGTLTVTNSTFSGNSVAPHAVDGGGISNSGTLTVVNSTFSGNSAPIGGGISNGDGTLTVTNSTFSGNSAGDGGGISDFRGTVAVTNSTFSGNSAGNGGGIYNLWGTVTVTNSVVANSTSGGNCSGTITGSGTITDGGHNIADDGSCGFSGTSRSNTNPMLDSAGLANNGGPTQTIALQATSPAINAGEGSVCAAPPVNHLDQRGFERPGIGHTSCSIGAYEADASAPCVVGTGTGASCTESALDACLLGGAGSTGVVTFDCGGAATITVTSTKTISADTTIDGGSLITISGGNSVGVFSVNTGVTFTVQNLTIANGHGGGTDGGGITNRAGTLTVTNSTFSGNSAADGGGIANGGTLTVTNSTFSGNSAGDVGTGVGDGGGIANLGGTLTVTNSTFSANSASGDVSGGGAIANRQGTLTLTNCTLSGNSATFGGGAILNIDLSGHAAHLTLQNCTFVRNDGGGILSFGTLTLGNTIVANSRSGGDCRAFGEINDGGHNLITDAENACGFTKGVNGNIVGVDDPHLDPAGLANNGGPTQTIALESDSPAINAGDPAICANQPVNGVDQRGFARPGSGHTQCSIGAYEAEAVSPAACVGDCNGTGSATIDEIITLVNIALGTVQASACPHGVPNGTEVNVALIIQAVNNVLSGCRGG